MKITTDKQIMEIEPVIGVQNVQAAIKALKDGGEIWFFLNPEEIKTDPELPEEGKVWCRNIFAKGDNWAGWAQIQSKPKPYVPGFSADIKYNCHGNSRCVSTNSHHESIH